MTGESQSGMFLNFRKAEGRWSRLGSYYAMFPVTFAENVISAWTERRETVIDPFCGRGTTPFVAMGMGRYAIGCDVNPVAWLYSKTKIDPHPDSDKVVRRISEVSKSVRTDESEPRHEFQRLAFCPRVLGFIRAARRMLDWRNNRLDRTVMTFLIHHLHDKLGHGLSNQLRHSRAMSPSYSIKWWKRKGYSAAPEIDPLEFLTQRVHWRYAKGIVVPFPGLIRPQISLGDGAVCLPKANAMANLVLTSPPYSGITNYRSDNWLRLWAMGEGPSLPDWNPEQKFDDIDNYVDMLVGVFASTAKRARPDSIWYIRSDARAKTKDAIQSVLDALLPNHQLEQREAPYKHKTQTALYGDHEPKPGEVDLIYTPPRQ